MDLYTLKSIDKIQGKNQQITIPGVRSNNRKIIVASVFKRSIYVCVVVVVLFNRCLSDFYLTLSIDVHSLLHRYVDVSLEKPTSCLNAIFEQQHMHHSFIHFSDFRSALAFLKVSGLKTNTSAI